VSRLANGSSHRIGRAFKAQGFEPVRFVLSARVLSQRINDDAENLH
jgi:hypothetical protein